MADAKKPDGEHSFHPVLTDEQFKAAQAKARKRVDDERVKAAMAEIEDKTYDEERRKQGLVTGTLKDELVSYTVDLVDPEINSCLIVNFKQYWHGHTYEVPQHVADSLAEMAYRLAKYTSREIDGKPDKDFYRKRRNITLGAQGQIVQGTAPQQVGGL